MHDLIKSYLLSKSLAWSETTLRSEGYRLSGTMEVLDGNPHALWDFLTSKKMKPYSKLTTWTRVINFWDWCIEEGHRDGINEYRKFKKENARVFKNTYLRRAPTFSRRDVNSRIEQLVDPEIQAKARQLLDTGMRYTESLSLKDGIVVGKGGKRRRIFCDGLRQSEYEKSYSTFRKRMAKIGLKPHDLRKVFLNEAVKNGANVFELCALAGWANINTASSYIAIQDKALESLVRRING